MKLGCKTIFFLGSLLLMCFVVPAQTSQIDSLKHELLVHKAEDSTRVNILNELAYHSHRKDVGQTLDYLEESSEISGRIDYSKGNARSLYLRGTVDLYQANFAQATEQFQRAFQLYDSIGYRIGVSQCYSAQGMVAYSTAEYEEAIALLNKSLEVAQEIGKMKGTASILLNMGNVYADWGKYPESTSLYEQALELHMERNNDKGISQCLNNLGTVYSDLGNYPLALEYYNKAYFLYQKNEDNLGISKSLNNLASIYKHQENYDKALVHFEQSLEMQEKSNNRKSIVRLKNNMGNVYRLKKDNKTALEYFKSALELGREIGAHEDVIICLNNIGTIYFSQGEFAVARGYHLEAEANSLIIDNSHSLSTSFQGIAETYLAEQEYEKALTYTLKSKEVSDEMMLLIHQIEVQSLLFKIYKGIGEFEKALVSHEKFKVLEDSLFNKENIEKMAQLEYEYKYKAELESAENREKTLTKTVKSTVLDLEKSQRNAFIAVIVILLISIASGGTIFYQKLRNAQAANQNILIEQKLLRSQMTPHFIFNSLSVLQGMILNKEEQQSISYLSRFSKLLRTVLENSRHKTVALENELMAIEAYMGLQNLSVEPPYEFNLKVDASLNNLAFKIPPMLIQPFIENATEHAFRGKKENKQIEVEIVFEDQKLMCTISDNGAGLKADQPRNSGGKKSLATTITAERLAMLSKYFEVQGSVEIQDKHSFGEQGTLVTLAIPYKIEKQ